MRFFIILICALAWGGCATGNSGDFVRPDARIVCVENESLNSYRIKLSDGSYLGNVLQGEARVFVLDEARLYRPMSLRGEGLEERYTLEYDFMISQFWTWTIMNSPIVTQTNVTPGITNAQCISEARRITGR